MIFHDRGNHVYVCMCVCVCVCMYVDMYVCMYVCMCVCMCVVCVVCVCVSDLTLIYMYVIKNVQKEVLVEADKNPLLE